MMDLNNIFEKIKNAKVEICKNDINIPTSDIVGVTGYGVCENNDYSENSYRYYLEFNIDKPLSKKGTLISILMNPSNKTNPNKNIDGTIQNVIKMAYIVGSSKIVILNSFALIQSNGNLAEKNFEDNNFAQPSYKTDCMYGRCLGTNGVYACPFLSNDYRGRVGTSFKDYARNVTAETDFCATCSKNNNFMFSIG